LNDVCVRIYVVYCTVELENINIKAGNVKRRMMIIQFKVVLCLLMR